MSWIHLVGVFCILAGFVQAQDNPEFEVKTPHFVQKGDSIDLTCKISTGALFLVQKQLRIVHKSATDGSERTVTEQGSLMQPFVDQPDVYGLKFDIDPTITATLSLKSVTDDMDGQFICQVVVVSDGTVSESAVSELTVVAGIEELEMTVEENIILDETKTLKFRESSISVLCTARGSNPKPILHLKMGDQAIDASNTVMADNQERRSYQGEVKYTLQFTSQMFGKRLSCHAETEIPEGFSGTLPDKTVSVKLEGLVDKPTIFCHNKTAGATDRQVTIKCLVSKDPTPKSVTFRLRDPGSKLDKVVLSPGNKTASLTECYKRAFNGTFTEYVLKFYQMEDWHFRTNIYFDVVGMDDKIHQQVVYLIKGPDDDVSAASSITATITVPILLALLTFLI